MLGISMALSDFLGRSRKGKIIRSTRIWYLCFFLAGCLYRPGTLFPGELGLPFYLYLIIGLIYTGNMTSQTGYVITLADKIGRANILHWSSTKCRRVTRRPTCQPGRNSTETKRWSLAETYWGRRRTRTSKRYNRWCLKCARRTRSPTRRRRSANVCLDSRNTF